MSELLTQLSTGLADVVTAAGPSIVRVEGRRRLAATGVIWSADGIIATADHVVPHKRQPKVALADGTVLGATVIGRDSTTDIALLKVEAADLQPLSLATADELRVGNLVLALGRPGKTVQATLGILSAIGGEWRTGAGGHIDRYMQTDVVMYPGFSGGPLVSAAGQLIGINSSSLARGVSITLPNQTIQRVADSLMAHGKVKRGYLGIRTQAVRLPEAIAGEVGQETGLLVAEVENGSPAEESGVLLGDTIISFAGHAVRQPDDLIAQLGGAVVGQKTPAQVLRSGSLTDLNIKVGERG